MQLPSPDDRRALRTPTSNKAGHVHACPPVLQFLTAHAPYLQDNLVTASQDAFEEGQTLDQICSVIFFRAQAFGYEATIGVQEVYSSNMPSFKGKTVTSALLMIDLRPLSAPGDVDIDVKPYGIS